MKPLLTTKQAEPYSGVAEGTLENWRSQGRGPKYVKIGRRVFYDPDDIAAWREAHKCQSSSEAEAA